MTEPASCSSCGTDATALVAVRRVYITPESWDQERSVTVVDDIEHWCDACVLHYPHQAVD